MKIGDTFRKERSFTKEEVLAFGELSKDQGRHHLEENEQGQLMVHGLLTASIGTEIGGDLNYIARNMDSEFLRPVFTGDLITCEVMVTDVEVLDQKTRVAMSSVYRNQKGKEVLVGSSNGVILNQA
ncbi:enoyl-CoA hydratase [Halobacillus sp. ACCC02827]|uniref:MaoC domain-containing protein dehydratase n=1 Tax=Bacillaceae TaxID=186817 RepID=UPI0002A50CAC|nr:MULTISPECIES: MaoC domain-containing protein dehydratase [Bacillaceae]ELK48093.1 MaoC domain-containing protein dehydratase [Halobacillus sp. BAB-2008]QHT45605.1 enoyl-CoA hydratase [Bacillus sp. SB49]WJE16402.1 enoyl-CoA hydratase [Halobacillus sp. ACCC02827]